MSHTDAGVPPKQPRKAFQIKIQRTEAKMQSVYLIVHRTFITHTKINSESYCSQIGDWLTLKKTQKEPVSACKCFVFVYQMQVHVRDLCTKLSHEK